MNLADLKDWILQPLIGVTEDHGGDSPSIGGRGVEYSTATQLMRALTDPPSYILQILFTGVAGFSSGTGDKSAWEVRLLFERHRYVLRDYRRSSWSIWSSAPAAPAKPATRRLIKKIRQSAKRLDTAIEPGLRKNIEQGNFYLVNSSRQVEGGYDFFRKMLESAINDLNEWRQTPPPKIEADPNVKMTKLRGVTISESPPYNEHMNKPLRLGEVISYSAVAMLAFFFSYVELLIDALFAFYGPDPNAYLEFRDKSWDERFKSVLPVGTDRKLKPVYEELRVVRKRVRDQVLHGLGGRPGLLVPFGFVGLVPVSYEDVVQQVHYSWQPVDDEEGARIVRLCTAFIDWTEASDSTWFVRRYLEFGFEIPFESTATGRVKSWMTTRDEFEGAGA